MTDTTADEIAIQKLIARAAQAADLVDEAGLDELYCPLWAEDAIWEQDANAVRPDTPAARNVGIAAIRQAGVDRRRAGQSGPAAGLMHMVTTSIIEVAGDTATGKSCFVLVNREGNLAGSARYDDKFRKIGGKWVIAHRHVKPK